MLYNEHLLMLPFFQDPDRFPVPRVRDIVDYLHAHDQHYIVMVDVSLASNILILQR